MTTFIMVDLDNSVLRYMCFSYICYIDVSKIHGRHLGSTRLEMPED